MTPMQRFLRDRYQEHYAQRHPLLSDTGEAELINAVVSMQYPFCRAEQFSRKGYTRSGVQRYICKDLLRGQKQQYRVERKHCRGINSVLETGTKIAAVQQIIQFQILEKAGR